MRGQPRQISPPAPDYGTAKTRSLHPGYCPMTLDETHNPTLKSFIASANAPDCDFPIQNLPYGAFRPRGAGGTPRIGVAIGAAVLDIAAVADLMDEPAARAARACAAPHLNGLMELGPP